MPVSDVLTIMLGSSTQQSCTFSKAKPFERRPSWRSKRPSCDGAALLYRAIPRSPDSAWRETNSNSTLTGGSKKNRTFYIPSGKLTVRYGKWPIEIDSLDGSLNLKIVIFNSHVKLPEGNIKWGICSSDLRRYPWRHQHQDYGLWWTPTSWWHRWTPGWWYTPTPLKNMSWDDDIPNMMGKS